MNGRDAAFPLDLRPRRLRLRTATRALLTLAALCLAGSLGFATSASASPARLAKVFGGPVSGGVSACGPDAVVANNRAGLRQDYCVAFRITNDEGPDGKDLTSQILDTAKGFSGNPDGVDQCTDAQFAATSENDSTCPAGSQVGEVTSKVRAKLGAAASNPFITGGLGSAYDPSTQSATLTPTGAVYDLQHSSNEVARLGIDLRPTASVLGIPAIDEPNVKVIVRVILRPNPDVGLRSIIERLPTTADVEYGGLSPRENGRPLALDEFSFLFYGQSNGTRPAKDGAPVPFAFLGSDCTNDQITHIEAVDELGTRSTIDSAAYRLTDCDNPDLTFAPSAEYTTSENRPDVTTETSVKVRFGQSTNPAYAQTAVKRTIVTLPDGLSFSGQIASGAKGLPLCRPEQFAFTSNAPATCDPATAVGTVSFKSPLLSQRLVGSAFLGAQPARGELPELYIQAELGPAADAPRVKLISRLTIDDRNRIQATLENLPEVLVEEFALSFRGGDQSAVVTPPTCGTFSGALSAFSYAKPTTPVDSAQSYSVTADCDAVKGFAPSVSFAVDNAAAGARSPLTTTVSRPDRSPRLARTVINLPPGTVANLRGVPECSTSDAAAGTCPAATKVGTVSGLAGVGPAPYRAPGEVFLVQRQPGAVAGLAFRVPVVFGEVDLGVLNVAARVEIRPDDLTLRVIADVPERFKGIPLNIRSLTIRLDRPGFAQNGTNCSPLSTTSQITSNTGITADARAGLQFTGCGALRFTPDIAAAVSGQTSAGGRPLVQVRVQNEAGNSSLRQTFVTLPDGLGFDLRQVARACDKAVFLRNGCPPVARIGAVSGALGITDEPLSGGVYLLKPSGGPLPGVGLSFTGRFAGNVAGSTAIDTKTGRLITRFDSVPDLPLTTLQLDIAGGPGSVLIATDKLCKAPSVAFAARFVAQGGQTADRTASTYCGSRLSALAPVLGATFTGVRSGRPSLVLSAKAPLDAKTGAPLKITRLDITLPRGASFSEARASRARGVAVKELSLKGRSRTKRISAGKLCVSFPGAGTTKAKILVRTGTILATSRSLRRSKAKQTFGLVFTYAGGQKEVVPLRLTPR